MEELFSNLYYAGRFNHQWCYMQLPYLDMVPIFLLMGKQGLGKENGHPLSHATGPTLHTRHLMEPHCSSIIPQVPIELRKKPEVKQ